MGWLSKVFGIDSRRARDKAMLEAQQKAADAQKQAADQAKITAENTAKYNAEMVTIQNTSLKNAQDNARSEQARIDEARQRAAKMDEEDAARQLAADTLAANNRVDLRADTVANVIAGGTAEVVATETTKKKRGITAANPVSTQLGIIF